MNDAALIDALALIGTLGCGLAAGFFFAFSVCVMSALRKLPAAQGAAAMQWINVVVINPWFMTVFLGMTIISVAAAIVAVIHIDEPSAHYLLVGGALYAIGTFGVTMGRNVPLNNALAAVAPDSPQAGGLWTRYLSIWTAWNHVRTLAALAAAVAFCLGLRR